MSSSCWPLESFDSLRSLRTRANGKGAMIAPPFALAHANREQMCTHADNRRLGLEQPGELDDVGPRDRVRPPRLEVGEKTRRPLDAEDPDVRKAGVGELLRQFLRPMEVGGREVVQAAGLVAVLRLPQISIPNLDERGVAQQPSHQAVER